MSSIPLQPTPWQRPEELLAQTGWLRALAARLLADRTAAEDVAQEAWIAALERPPRADRQAWLARVVRNLAWKRRRGDARRAAHEREAFAAEPVPGPAATAERLELQRTVLAAVEAIREPFRTVVVERYLEGRSSADIARALGVPEGTVRWRLKRGLAELREHLDARYGGREAWSAILAPLAVPPSAAASGSAPASGALAPLGLETGVLVMIGASKIVLAAALGAVALGFVLWHRGRDERTETVRAEVGEAPRVAERASEPVLANAPEPREERREAEVASSEEPAALREAPTAPPGARPTAGVLALRFVDPQGAPWQGVDLVRHGSGEVLGTSAHDGRLELRLPAAEARASNGPREGATGSAEAAQPRSEWTAVLLARRSGCATRLIRAALTAGRTTDLGDVVLGPGTRIEGRVLDEAQAVIAGAEVGLAGIELLGDEDVRLGRDETYLRRQGSAAFDRTLAVRSGPDGSFALDGVTPGRWRLWARAAHMRAGWTEPFEVRAGEGVFGVEVRLPALLETDRISGIVLDPRGEPLAFARLVSSYEFENEGSTSSDDVGQDGRFELVIARDTRYSFIARDREGRYSDAFAYDVPPGTRELELRLGEKRTFEVWVHDRDGRAVEGCRIELGVRVAAANESDRRATVVEPGVYALALPTIPFALEVEADGFAPARFEHLRPEAVGRRYEVVLDPAPRLRGRVRADGRGVPGARVALHGAVVGGYWHNDFACRYEEQELRAVTCDEDGRFELTCPDTGSVWLRASSPGWVAGELGPLEPNAADELALELTAGGSIEGRVLLPDGADATGVLVGVNHGDGHARTLRAGPEGRFRFDALAPGPWQVLRRESEIDPSSTSITSSDTPFEIEWSCTVEAGRVTRHDLDLSRR